MNNNKVESNEVELQQMIVKFQNKDTQLTLTNKQILFEQEKGLFIKKLKIVYKLSLNDIKVYNDAVQIKQDNKQIIMQTTRGDISFLCDNLMDAIKIKEKIVNVKTGKNAYERAELKFKNWQKTAIGGLVSGVVARLVWDHKDDILKGIKTFFIKRK